MKGFGTVVTGTLLSGSIRIGDALTLGHGSRAVRVRGLQTHGRPEEIVRSSSRVALNLAGIDVCEVSRGQTLVTPDTLTAVSFIEVEVALLPGVRFRNTPPLPMSIAWSSACRHCLRLAYESQREAPHCRALRKAQGIHEKSGGSGGSGRSITIQAHGIC
jgi:selenocysteine-specific translation elongation factor